MPLTNLDQAALRPVGLWRSRGLRWGVAAAVMLGSSLMAMFGLMYWRSTALMLDTTDRSVVEQLELLSARPPDMLPFMIASRMIRHPAVVTLVGLFEPGGQPIVGDVALMPDRMVLNGQVQAASAPGLRPLHWRAAGRRLPDGRILIVARSADELLEVRAGLLRSAIVGIVPAVLLCLGCGTLVGVATERRMRGFNAVAERIIAGDMRERLPERAAGDELDRLCTIVNRMLGRLEEGVEALKGVGETIAHDLRTPLTVMRARLERSQALAGSNTPLGRSIGQSIEGVDQALSIVTALLRISEIQHVRRAASFEAFDLAQVVQETADSYQPVAEDKCVDLTVLIATPATIIGDRQLMTEALVNLVDNAVKFTPRAGQVSLTLAGTPARPVITISDTGPGIPLDARSAVFQRFYRVDASRTTPGSGLGLSLVAAVLDLHRFNIRLEANNPGCRVDLLCWNDDLLQGRRSGWETIGLQS